jgi:hypothetical protein
VEGTLCANSGHSPLYVVAGRNHQKNYDNKKSFDPALCDSPKLIDLSP